MHRSMPQAAQPATPSEGDDTAAASTRRGSSEVVLASERYQERKRALASAHRQRRVRRYRSLVSHWMSRWPRRPRPMAPATVPEVTPGQVSISFGGHATVLLRYAERTVLCDPMLGNWVKGAKRAAAPGLSAESLREVDLVLISHTHADHLHRPTLEQLPRSATLVLPPGGAAKVSGLGFARVVEIEVGQSIQDRGIDIATAPVRHGDQDAMRALSYIIRGDGPSIYFCGDSGYFSGFAEIGERHQPDIALLPIGGYFPLSFRERHMSPLDALYALEDLRARVMIPIHHGAFALSYERLDEPRRWLSELVAERRLEDFVIELAPGESRVFVPPRRQRESADAHGLRDPAVAAPTPAADTPPGPGAGPGSGRGPRSGRRADSQSDTRVRGLRGADKGATRGVVQPLPALRAALRIRESGLHPGSGPVWVHAAPMLSELAEQARTPAWAQPTRARWEPVELGEIATPSPIADALIADAAAAEVAAAAAAAETAAADAVVAEEVAVDAILSETMVGSMPMRALTPEPDEIEPNELELGAIDDVPDFEFEAGVVLDAIVDPERVSASRHRASALLDDHEDARGIDAALDSLFAAV